MSIDHPTWEDLVRHLETGEPDVRDHMTRCSRCEGLVRSAAHLLEGLGASRLPRPPRRLIEEALSRVCAEASRDVSLGARLGRAVREVAASLVADSLTPSHALRGAATAVPRMLLFETDRHSIAVSLGSGESPGTADVLGQVSPKSGGPLDRGRAVLSCGSVTGEDTLSEFGEFAFRGVARGLYRIEVELGDDVIRVGPIDGGASA